MNKFFFLRDLFGKKDISVKKNPSEIVEQKRDKKISVDIPTNIKSKLIQKSENEVIYNSIENKPVKRNRTVENEEKKKKRESKHKVKKKYKRSKVSDSDSESLSDDDSSSSDRNHKLYKKESKKKKPNTNDMYEKNLKDELIIPEKVTVETQISKPPSTSSHSSNSPPQKCSYMPVNNSITNTKNTQSVIPIQRNNLSITINGGEFFINDQNSFSESVEKNSKNHSNKDYALDSTVESIPKESCSVSSEISSSSSSKPLINSTKDSTFVFANVFELNNNITKDNRLSLNNSNVTVKDINSSLLQTKESSLVSNVTSQISLTSDSINSSSQTFTHSFNSNPSPNSSLNNPLKNTPTPPSTQTNHSINSFFSSSNSHFSPSNSFFHPKSFCTPNFSYPFSNSRIPLSNSNFHL
jgi:hypothetical protein